MNPKALLATLLLFLGFARPHAQDKKTVDSLLALQGNITDRQKTDTYNLLAKEYATSDSLKTAGYTDKALALADKIAYLEGVSDALYHIGRITVIKGDYPKALQLYQSALEKALAAKYALGEANAYNGFGIVYSAQAEYPAALEQYLKSLKIHEALTNRKGMADTYNNIGRVYSRQGDYPTALEYQLKALKIHEALNNKSSMAVGYNNIANINYDMGDYETALTGYRKAASIAEAIGNKTSFCLYLNNIADAIEHAGRLDSVPYFAGKSLALATEIGNKRVMARANIVFGKFHSKKRNPKEAAVALLKALHIAEAARLREEIQIAYKHLYLAYKAMGRYEEAMTAHEKFIALKDSAVNEENTKKTTGMAMQYQFDKEKEKTAAHNENAALEQRQKLQEQKYLTYGVLGGLMLLLALAAAILRNNLQKQKSNRLLAVQNGEIQQQNEEIKQQSEEIMAQRDMLEERNGEVEAEKKQVQEAYENIQLLSKIGREITRHIGTEAIIDTVYAEVNKLMDASVFLIGVYDPRQNHIEIPFSKENGENYPAFVYRLNEIRPAVDCFLHCQELIWNDVPADYARHFGKEQPAAKIGQSPESLIYMPLLVDEKAVGVISVQSFRKNAYNQNHLNMFRNIALYTAIALDNARLYSKTETLLLNILPKETAEELKENGRATTKYYEKVTVLFTDFKGFTQMSEKMHPEEVVENLNHCFTAFDRICKKHRIEKIKTIGDSYMCAAGIPTADTDNPIRMLEAALEMIAFMQTWKAEKAALSLPVWDLRLGIHTGSVMAGVVGEDKFAYDIWGDTVNTASRMESSGEPSMINISTTTYHLVKDRFECTYRGEVTAKNKGQMGMYFVSITNQK